MASREASLKLGVRPEGFVRGMQDARRGAEREAKAMGGAMARALSSGIKGGLDSVRGAFSSLKTFVGGLGLLHGIPGLKDQVSHAVRMESKYRQLAFAIKAGSGVAVQWRDIQRQVQQTALETGNKTEELAESFGALVREMQDPQAAGQAMRAIAVAATASGESVQNLTAVSTTLNEKFGVTAGQMDEALRTVLALGNKGGVSVQDMAEKLGLVGSSAKAAGLSGVEGFGKVAALLNLADGSTGNLRKGIGAVAGIIDTLGNQAERNKVLLKLGLDPKQVKGDAIQQIGKILEKTRGSKDKLAVAFQGEQLKLIADLGATFATAFEETGGDVQTKTAAALDAYNKAVEAAGKSTLTQADMQAQFASEMESTERKIAQALTRLEETFAKPEITASIQKLAKHLPELAETIAKVGSFAIDNPLAAGGVALGGLFAKGAVEGLIMSAFTRGATAAAPTLAGAIAQGAPGLASGFGGAMGPIGAVIAAGLAGAIFAGMREMERQETERRARGKEATAILDADRQAINSTLRAQGIDVSPTAGLSPELAGRTTATAEERDKLEQAIAFQRSNAFKLSPEQQQRLAARFGGDAGPQFTPGPGEQATVAPAAATAPRFRPAAESLDALAAKELRVRVVNPKEIGSAQGGGGALSGGAPVPGWRLGG